MNDHPTPTELLDRATTGLAPDVDRLVAGGIARGRRTQRRRRAGATLAAVAVFGVIGAAASLVPHPDGRSGSTPVADDTGTPTATATPSEVPPETPSASVSLPPQTPSATATPASPPAGAPTDRVTVTARQVPGTFEQLLGRSDAGPLRLDPPYGAASGPHDLVAHFSWQGTLTSLLIERFDGDAQQSCQQSAGPGDTCTTDAQDDPMLLWGPDTNDGVSAQGATVWRDGFEVNVLSYNAAEGKGSPALTKYPPISMDDLSLLAASDAWFS